LTGYFGIVVDERDAQGVGFGTPEFEPAQTVVTTRVSWNNGEVDAEEEDLMMRQI
jgi:hypothetical protein